jgi:ABC-type antimicrobial peptide transport system permease subunit
VIRVALKDLAGRKLRSVLTAFAIVLGVAMVSGTYVLTDTISAAFDSIFTDSYEGTDVVVTGKGADISFQGGPATTPPVPESMLEEVRSNSDVAAAVGALTDESTTLIGKDGEPLETMGAPRLGFGIDPSEERFNTLDLVEGAWPSGDRQVAIDAATADNEDYSVGDSIGIAVLGPAEQFQVVGIARFGAVDSIGSATFAVFDIDTAQRLFDKEGELDGIQVAGNEGVAPEQLVASLAAELPDSVVVRTAADQAAEESDETSEALAFIQYFLLAFGGIALFVGAFVIFNTLSITIAQRAREFATLRTIGASRRQVLGSVIVEALAIGILASITGLFLGLLLAIGLNKLFESFGVDLPQVGTVFATRTIVVSLVLGIAITLIAGLFPAVRATRVPPIAAVREGATLPRSALAPFMPFIAAALVVLSVAALGYGMFADELGTAERLLTLAAGVLLLFTAVATLSSRFVPVLSTVLTPISYWLMVVLGAIFYPVTVAFWLLRYAVAGRRASLALRILAPFGAIGLVLLGAAVIGTVAYLAWPTLGVLLWVGFGFTLLALLVQLVVLFAQRSNGQDVYRELPHIKPDPSTRKLAGENARRNPGRTAATAAALMIGLALVTFVASLGEGMRRSNTDAIEDQVLADYIVTSQDGFTPFPPAAGDALDDAQGVETASDVRASAVEAAGSTRYLVGIEPDTILDVYRFDWKEGDDDLVRNLDGAIVSESFADAEDLRVGSTVDILTPDNKRFETEVAGIYTPPPFYPILGDVIVTKSVFDDEFDRPRNQFTFANVSGEPTETTTAGLEEAVAGFPDADVRTRQQFVDDQEADIAQFLNLLYVLLALSVIVSLFGMVNTLVLSVFERTRELGMLRAVGMTRRQVRRMIRHESVITALIGATLGLPLGIFLCVLVTRALSEFGLQFAFPWKSLLVFAFIAVVAGLFAAIVPARRAARLNVLRALQYE